VGRGTKPYAVFESAGDHRIVATVAVLEGLLRFWLLDRQHLGSACGKKPALVRVDATKHTIRATLPIPRPGPRADHGPAEDSVWMVSDKTARSIGSTLPRTECVKRFRYRPGPITPFFSDGIVWVTGVESSGRDCRGCRTGKVIESVHVGLSLGS